MKLRMSLIIVACALATAAASAATLDVNNDAAMGGGGGTACDGGPCGLEVIMTGDTEGAYVQSDHPNEEKTFRARFLFNPNGVTMQNDKHIIFATSTPDPNNPGKNKSACRVNFFQRDGSYWVRGQIRKNGGGTDISPKIELGPVGTVQEFEIVVEWQAGDDNDPYGFLRITVDGTTESYISKKNKLHSIVIARLGVILGLDATTTGSHYFDGYESFRTLAP
jgi:hypothetical protein